MATTYLLTKLSAPGWDKEFISREALRYELMCYICTPCLDYIEKSGMSNRDIDDLLSTHCGAEFMVEELKEKG